MPLSPRHKVTVKNAIGDTIYDKGIFIDNPMFATTSTSPQHQNSNSSHPSSPALNGENGSSHSSHQGNGQAPRKKMQGFEISQYSHSFDDENNSDTDSVATPQGPSNENLLGTAFCTFMGFALVQTVVAISAGSEAMLGDSAAMIVDALTYLFNWYAEHKKASFETREWKESCPIPPGQNAETRQRILDRTKRKNVLQMELVPPILSVSTLIIVTGVVLNKSIRVLILDRHRAVGLQGNPNVHIMMYFSIANLGLDLVNVANFAAAKHLFGYATAEEGPPQGHEALTNGEVDEESDPKHVFSTKKRAPSHEDLDCDEDQDHHANLNMCSAYTVSEKKASIVLCVENIFSGFLKTFSITHHITIVDAACLC
jgi:hypothetical protein